MLARDPPACSGGSSLGVAGPARCVRTSKEPGLKQYDLTFKGHRGVRRLPLTPREDPSSASRNVLEARRPPSETGPGAHPQYDVLARPGQAIAHPVARMRKLAGL